PPAARAVTVSLAAAAGLAATRESAARQFLWRQLRQARRRDHRLSRRRGGKRASGARLQKLQPARLGAELFQRRERRHSRHPHLRVAPLARQPAVAKAADAHAAERCCAGTPFLKVSMIALLKAGMSSGFRLVTRPPSITTSRSTHVAPAFFRSVFKDGHDVTVRPRTISASISVHGPWPIAAIGFRWSKIARTKRTAASFMRSRSGLATPPGNRSASYSSGRASSSVRSTGIL